MCGISGFYSPSLESSALNHISSLMVNALTHRGPDDKGTWIDERGLAIGHTRLSIIDLSSNGSQPMISADGRFVVSYNGEIYNHLHLRERLNKDSANIQWRGSSDTETLSNCIMFYGFSETLKLLQGMFAIAAWDQKLQRLYLAIDRFGEKPIYFGFQKNSFAFASDLNAIKQHPDFSQLSIDRDSLGLFFKYNCIPSPFSIYKGVKKLRGGEFLCADLKKDSSPNIQISSYWSTNKEVEHGINNQFDLDQSEIESLVHKELSRVISDQMIGDVPVGVFLSGGIDSSLIACLMQDQSMQPIRSFSIGFEDKGFNESEDAKFVADTIGSMHTNLILSNNDIIKTLEEIPMMYSEPFSDSSQIPTYLVSKLATSDVKVALTGDGADEIFGGYNRYHSGYNTWSKLNSIHPILRNLLMMSMQSVSPRSIDRIVSRLNNVLPNMFDIRLPGYKVEKLADSLKFKTNVEYYLSLLTHWSDAHQIVLGNHHVESIFSDENSWPDTDNFQHKMMAVDSQSYMADDILVKIDRAAMWNSLETRAPYLDHKLFQIAWRIPFHQKVDLQTKQPLRNILKKYLPESHLKKPKMGFGIPIDELLRKDLATWAMDLLDPQLIKDEGYLNHQLISDIWSKHLRSEGNFGYLLWDILMFQTWYRNQKA